MTPTGSGLRSTRRGAGRACGDLRHRLDRKPDMKSSATERPPQSRRRWSGRTKAPHRRPDAHSRWRQSSAHQRSPCALPRLASLPPLPARLHAPVPALGGWVPSSQYGENCTGARAGPKATAPSRGSGPLKIRTALCRVPVPGSGPNNPEVDVWLKARGKRQRGTR